MAGVGTILVAAGSSERIGAMFPKQFLPLGPDPMFFLALESVLPHSDEVAIVTLPGFVGSVKAILRAAGASTDLIFRGTRVVPVTGGERRQDSVERGLEALSDGIDIVLIHDAARPFASPDLAERVIAAAREHGAAVPVISVPDTVKRVRDDEVTETVDRNALGLAQTPQGFRREIIERAYRELEGADVTDDARAVELMGERVAVVPGESGNFKVTTPVDLELASVVANCRRGLGPGYRAGTGSDTHRLVEGRDLVLCGVTIPFAKGLDGHSDADVATHAVCDALLGAVAEGDIGVHFPPGDPEYKGISSLLLLEKVAEIVRGKRCRVVNVDVTIVAEAPKLAPHVPEMRRSLASVLGLDAEGVSVKATTTEGMGPEGEGLAISSSAVVVVTERP
ncbi:MAG: 2-C-methyl-D-erythritol 4-phosphate cytidylyltransferase [Candidatus Eisenbacteria bacterium]|nr:2-C-methyl-D-erythritol 4-phosphate cytidylyltransferase [Candidatus Eisenbacteria bacterium]